MSESFHDAGHPAASDPADRDLDGGRAMSDASDQASPQHATPAEPTGHEGVDAVVASLAGLDDLPVAEHVAVFEQAHESLRRTLAGAGQDGPAAGRD